MGGKQAVMLYGGIGVGVLLVIGVIIGIVAATRRRNSPSHQTWS